MYHSNVQGIVALLIFLLFSHLLVSRYDFQLNVQHDLKHSLYW